MLSRLSPSVRMTFLVCLVLGGLGLAFLRESDSDSGVDRADVHHSPRGGTASSDTGDISIVEHKQASEQERAEGKGVPLDDTFGLETRVLGIGILTGLFSSADQ